MAILSPRYRGLTVPYSSEAQTEMAKGPLEAILSSTGAQSNEAVLPAGVGKLVSKKREPGIITGRRRGEGGVWKMT